MKVKKSLRQPILGALLTDTLLINYVNKACLKNMQEITLCQKKRQIITNRFNFLSTCHK